MRQGSLHCWFAVLLLIFASVDICADMVSPQPCYEEIENFAMSGASQNASATQVTNDEIAFDAANDSQQEPSSNPSCNENECFCCCSHILPTVRFDVAILNTEPTLFVFKATLLPVPPSQSQFHPPRLS